MSTTQDAGSGMQAEFGTFAAWTAEAVRALGGRYAVPAACRGSGTPAALRWLLAGLAPGQGQLLLDVGAGLGGPAEFARRAHAVVPVCVDPMQAACDAVGSLFGLSAVRADGARIPFGDRTFEIAWSLGTLCTTDNKVAWLHEWRRVLVHGGRLGLFVLVSTGAPFSTPQGNAFASLAELDELWHVLGYRRVGQRWTRGLRPAGLRWQGAGRAVEAEVRRAHGTDPQFHVVKAQERQIGELLATDRVRGLLAVLQTP